jgi:rRNA maturation protein Nop10
MTDTTIPVSKPATVNKAISTPDAPKVNQPIEVVELPSNGYFYPEAHPLSSGKIEIYQVTARHEDILSNTNLLKKGTVLDEFLKALIATPNVAISDLLIGDKNALFIAARKSAYGEIYNTKVKCPECGVESNVDIDLSKLVAKNIEYVGATRGENKLTFKLPNSGKTVAVSLLTHKDESDIDAELKALAKFGGANNTNAPEITTRLKYTIRSIDGDADRLRIKNFVDGQLTAKDSLALRRFVRENTPDMDMNFDFTCPACGHQTKMTVPLGANFFWPNISEN